MVVPETDKSAVDHPCSLVLKCNGVTAAAATVGVGCGEVRDTVSRIDQPTLPHGEHHQTPPLAAGSVDGRAHTRGPVRRVDRCRHASMLTRPNEVTASMHEFLRRVTEPRCTRTSLSR